MSDKRDMLEALTSYGRKSVMGLERGVDDVRDMAQDFKKQVPDEVDRYAGMVASLLPAYSAYESGQLGHMASREFDKGNYGDAIMHFADSMDKATDSLIWFIPGMGLIKAPK